MTCTRSLSVGVFLGAVACSFALLLSGCALTSTASPGKSDPVLFSGQVYGGETPIVGATISFYETATTTTTSGGVYVPAAPLTALGSTITTAGGAFSFATPLACSSTSNYVYATSAGGNTGAGGHNPQALLVAAVGSCSGFGASTFVNINEPSTVAAAYALQGFSSVSGSFRVGEGITSYSITSNVATFNAANTLSVGQPVVISDFTTSSFLNGNYYVASSTGTSFTVALTHADVATTTETGRASEGILVSSYSVTNGVLTLVGANSVSAGQVVKLFGFSNSALNGNYNVLASGLSSTQFSVATTSSDIPTTSESTDAATFLVPASVPVLSIVSSSTNYATATSAIGSTPSAAGLAHAFANAAMLKPAAQFDINSSVPGNAYSVIPVAVIHALANTLQGCVNSTGGTATNASANDGTTCGKLMSYTTNPITSVVPTNTFSAALNVVHFPTQKVYSLCTLAPSQGAFGPTLACAGSDATPTTPHDWSLAVQYTQGSGNTNGSTTCSSSSLSTNTNGLCYPWYATLDINDNVFVTNTDSSAENSSNLVILASNGTPVGASAVDSTTNTAPSGGIVDRSGYFYFANNSSSTAAENIAQFDSSANFIQNIGVASTYPLTVAVDAANTLWVGRGSTSGSVYKFTRSGNTFTRASPGGTDTGTGYAYSLAIQPTTNDIWIANYSSSTAIGATVLPYTGSTYGNQITISGQTGKNSYGMVLDSSGTPWANSTAGAIWKVTPTRNGSSVVTSASDAATATYTPAGTVAFRYMTIDGNNTLWTTDYNGTPSAQGVISYNTVGTGTFTRLFSCIVSGTTSTCPSSGTTYGVYYPRIAVPDSTGTLWIPQGSNHGLLQIIGAAAPTWPLPALQLNGVMP